MAHCLHCGVETPLGNLCGEHARTVAICTDITAEQIASPTVDSAPGWLIDQWGATHPLSANTLIGRDPAQCSVSILHHSVSALHAQIDFEGDRGRVQDRGSLNGTFVNGERIRSGSLFDGDLLRVGDVCFYASTTAGPSARAGGGTGRTVPTRGSDIATAVVLTGTSGDLELVQRIAGGVGRLGDTSFELARLEFGLLQALIDRKRLHPDPELCFVSSAELSATLEFQSRDADSDNVRELVRRVRRKLAAAGADGLIESRQGVGYRLSWDVRAASR
jgi:hypothetical protein